MPGSRSIASKGTIRALVLFRGGILGETAVDQPYTEDIILRCLDAEEEMAFYCCNTKKNFPPCFIVR